MWGRCYLALQFALLFQPQVLWGVGHDGEGLLWVVPGHRKHGKRHEGLAVTSHRRAHMVCRVTGSEANNHLAQHNSLKIILIKHGETQPSESSGVTSQFYLIKARLNKGGIERLEHDRNVGLQPLSSEGAARVCWCPRYITWTKEGKRDGSSTQWRGTACEHRAGEAFGSGSVPCSSSSIPHLSKIHHICHLLQLPLIH